MMTLQAIRGKGGKSEWNYALDICDKTGLFQERKQYQAFFILIHIKRYETSTTDKNHLATPSIALVQNPFFVNLN